MPTSTRRIRGRSLRVAVVVVAVFHSSADAASWSR